MGEFPDLVKAVRVNIFSGVLSREVIDAFTAMKKTWWCFVGCCIGNNVFDSAWWYPQWSFACSRSDHNHLLSPRREAGNVCMMFSPSLESQECYLIPLFHLLCLFFCQVTLSVFSFLYYYWPVFWKFLQFLFKIDFFGMALVLIIYWSNLEMLS